MSETEYDDELVSSSPNQRNWRGIFIAILVIMAVLALIVTSVVLLTPPDQGPRVKQARVKLDEVLGYDFIPNKFNGTWISEDELIFRDENNHIVIFSVRNLNSTILMLNSTYRQISAVRFSLSPDRKYILLAHNMQKLFRYSYLAQYSVYDINANELFPLTMPTEETKDSDTMESPFLSYANWIPRGNSILILYNYDIYYKLSPKKNSIAYRITNTGIPGVIFNGIPDWLYEEEIFNDNKAVWLSHDGQMLLYLSFNDTEVAEHKFPWYGVNLQQDDMLSQHQLYPQIRSLRYPKAGTKNPKVTVHVADLSDPKNIKTKIVHPPIFLQNIELYFISATWLAPLEVSIVWLSRNQSLSVDSICKTPFWKCQLTHQTKINYAWIEPATTQLFSRDNNTYLKLSAISDGNLGQFRQVASVNIPKKSFLPLTHEKFEAIKITSWDQTRHIVYYLAVPEGKPSQIQLYCTKTNPVSNQNNTPICLTCDHAAILKKNFNKNLMVEPSTESPPTTTTAPTSSKKKKQVVPPKDEVAATRSCTYHNAIFSPNSEYFILECLGPGVPSVELFKIIHKKNVTVSISYVTTLQDNKKIYDKVRKVALPQVRTFPVEISGGYEAQVRLYLPPGLREEEITQYPLVLQVYGGPGSQLVVDKWKIDWSSYLASSRDTIVVQIDGRGSSGKGIKSLHQVYRKLGIVEVSDQLEVTEYLADTFHFIDKRRIGVWGWSYGGFVAAMLLSKEKQTIFQCGIAVAPITSWRLYDSVYTERYMGLPNATENFKAYDLAQLASKSRAENFKNKELYLIHGTADDNVHFQHSLLLAKVLTDAGIVYSQQIYPDENHSLTGVKKHLYSSMSTFFFDCFKKQLPSDGKTGLKNGGTGLDWLPEEEPLRFETLYFINNKFE